MLLLGPSSINGSVNVENYLDILCEVVVSQVVVSQVVVSQIVVSQVVVSQLQDKPNVVNFSLGKIVRQHIMR